MIRVKFLRNRGENRELVIVYCLVAKLCLTLCDPKDCSPPSLEIPWTRQEYWSGLPFPRRDLIEETVNAVGLSQENNKLFLLNVVSYFTYYYYQSFTNKQFSRTLSGENMWLWPWGKVRAFLWLLLPWSPVPCLPAALLLWPLDSSEDIAPGPAQGLM